MMELACLYYEVHSRFYRLSLETYEEAMAEVNEMAKALGHTLNDLAKLVTYARE
jgi:hypothetical protein